MGNLHDIYDEQHGGDKIRVVQWGTGAMGSGMIKMMLHKKDIELVGVISKRAAAAGFNDIGEFLDMGKIGVPVYSDPEDIISAEKCDIVLHATKSFVKEVFDDLKFIAERGVDCITIAEEMAYAWQQEPELAEKLDEIASENSTVILGTGINPGFVLDSLIVMLTGACIKVDRIEAMRVNDLSPFGKTVMETQGVGTTVEQFNEGIKKGTIVGHIGFPESIRMIADALGWEITRIEQTREPIISKVYRETPVVKVQPGMVAGCKHIGIGYDAKGNEKIKLIHPQQIHPHLEGVETGDYINIYGDPEIHFANKPEIPGGKGTIATTVNMIPAVYYSERSGLLSMLDFEIPRSIPDKD
ncbi:MAG: 2,4-diaminopentanoate dehydrogenase [Exilispira sp.]|jgi:4-hydroxy-tetrahydrodipicolinate reductase|nr:2,4-diaminopentanoate dehydrogenase [Exilispira sp.]